MSIDLHAMAKIRYNLGLFNIGCINNAFDTYKDYLKLNEIMPDKQQPMLGDVLEYLSYMINVENLADRINENTYVSIFNVLPMERKEPHSFLFTEYLLLPYLTDIIEYKPTKESILRYKDMAEYNAISGNIKYVVYWNYILLLLPYYNLDFILNHIDLVIEGNDEYRKIIKHAHNLKELVLKSFREFITSNLKSSTDFLSDKISIIELVNSETISIKCSDSIFKIMMDFIDNNGERFKDLLEERNGVS